MKKSLVLILSFVLLAFTACNDDDTKKQSNSVAFSVTSANLTENQTPVQIVFSEPTPKAGTLTISYAANAVAYGTDFTTIPAAEGNTIEVPFEKNSSSVAFIFNKLIDAAEGEVKNVVFTITDVSFNAVISGNSTTQINFNETASLGAALAAEVGGPTQPNHVFVDLSSGKMTSVPRVSWDLGFYSGSEFRIVLNSSLKMSAKQLTSTNIDEVQVADESMIIAQGAGFVNQVDNPAGLITETAIAEISDNDAENKVYLINMGSNPLETAPVVGADGSASGTSRGWKKVRILKNGNDYKIQFADIASTTHQEVTVAKNAAFNFTFFSLLNGQTVNVEPQKNQWDINFTTFTNTINFGGGLVPYFYPDFVVSNNKGGAKTYMVNVTETVTYDSFTLSNVVDANLTDDQRNIGSNWRSTSVNGPSGPVSQFVLRTDRFFVIKDPAGNIYKLRFTGGANVTGERGYPTFQYALLK